MTTYPLRRILPAVTLGAALALTAACNNAGGDAAAPAPAWSSAAAHNTAEICKSSGEAARTAVVDLLREMAGAVKSDKAPDEAELTRIYQSTFGTLRDDLTAASGKATDPAFAAVLDEIAAEADKLATSADPEAAGTDKFQAALDKLAQYCPEDGASPAAPAAGGAGAGEVGGKGSGCELPVTFSVPATWKAKDVAMEDDDPLAELGRKGSMQMVCEVDGRAAGLVAFLRVYVDTKTSGDAKSALREMVKGKKTRNLKVTDVSFGGKPGLEHTYELYSELLEEWSERTAFAVATGKGAVVIEFDGLEKDDPDAEAAYAQARSTLTVS